MFSCDWFVLHGHVSMCLVLIGLKEHLFSLCFVLSSYVIFYPIHLFSLHCGWFARTIFFGWFAWTPILTMRCSLLFHSYTFILSIFLCLVCTALHGHVSMFLICINMFFGGLFVRMWWVDLASNENLSDAKKVLIDEELFDGLCDKWNHHWNKLTYCLGIELLLIQCMGNVGR